MTAAAACLVLLAGVLTLATGASGSGPPAATERLAPQGSDLPSLVTPEETTPVTDALLGTGVLTLRDAALLSGGPEGAAAAQARLALAGFTAGTSRTYRDGEQTVVVAVFRLRDPEAARALLGTDQLGTTTATFDPGLDGALGRTVDQPTLHAASVTAARGRFLLTVAEFGPVPPDTGRLAGWARAQLALL